MAKAYIEPVRYLGVGLVIVGSFLIIAAMCRWMFLAPHNVQENGGFQNGGNTSDGGSDLHVITVAMGRSPRTGGNTCSTGNSGTLQSKPPDYFLVTEKPPSYEEAMSMLPPYTTTGPVQLHIEGNLGEFHSPLQSPRDLHSQHSPVGGATAGGSRNSSGRTAGSRNPTEVGIRDSLAVTTESLRKSSSNNSMEASGGVRDYTGVRVVSELRDERDVSIDMKGSSRASPPPQYEELLREIKENEAKENKKLIEKEEKEKGLKDSEIKFLDNDLNENIEGKSESNNLQEKEKQNVERDQENVILDEERKALSSERCIDDFEENPIVTITEQNTCADEANIGDQEVSSYLLETNQEVSTSLLETNLSEESPISNEPSSSNASVHSSNNNIL